MLKKNIFFMLIVLSVATLSFAASESTPTQVKGKVIEVNTQYNFAVVNLGGNSGIKVGSSLQVLRNDKEVAKLSVIKVRQTISAAEIKEIKQGEELKIDDIVILAAEQKIKQVKPGKAKEVTTKQAVKKEKAATVKQLVTETGINIRAEGDKSIAESVIKAAPSLVFDAANILLRDRGFIVTVANRENGLLVASKGLLLSRWEELWAGLSGAIDHELTLSIKIKEKTGASYMEVTMSTGYLKKDQYRKRTVKDNSYIYRELVDVITEIKNWTEGLASAAGQAEKKNP